MSNVNQEFVNMAKIARQRKTAGRQTVIALTQEKTSGRGMSLDVDGRETEKGED